MPRLLLFVACAIFFIQNTAAQKCIKGKVTYTGAAKIDGNVQVEVALQDVSLMDAPSKLIASTIIANPKTFPISYRVEYDPSNIQAGFTYAMSARITGPGDELLYINDVRTIAPLIEDQSPTIDIAVIRVGRSADISETEEVASKGCPPVKCPKPKTCPYGYQKRDGCEICTCNNPCNPSEKGKICPAGQRCSVETQADGTFAARCNSASKYEKIDKDLKDVQENNEDCNLPKVVGPCKALMPRFYYNQETKCCESFNYGGCQGNANNFETKDACEAACKA